MKRIFSMLDMNDVFDNTMLCNITNMQDKLLILNNAQWKEDVQNKPKLRTYILFKQDLFVENYVKYHMHKRNRSLFAQFRLGI